MDGGEEASVEYMASIVEGLFQIDYHSYHRYFTSTGTVLSIFAYLASFGYITSAYSITGRIRGWQLVFLILPGVVGIVMVWVGLDKWRDQMETQNELQDVQINRERAVVEWIEGQSKLQDTIADELDKGNATVSDLDQNNMTIDNLPVEDWNSDN